jgi:hypothetical protein
MRTFGLLSLLVTLALGGFLWAQAARESGPAASDAGTVERQAEQVVAAFNLQQAAPVMDAWFAEHATYAGAVLPSAAGVHVVRADAASYCLQAGAGVNVQHLVGPGNAPDAGPC